MRIDKKALMRRILLALGILSALLSTCQSVNADNPTTEGLSVSPYLEQIALNPNQNSDNYSILLTNHYPTTVLVHVSAQDFTNLNESGEVQFLSPLQDVHNPYSIDHSLQFAYSEVAIGPDQSREIPVTITNARSLATGGHYGAVIFKVIGSSSKGNNVVINQAIASLLFLDTVGQGTQSLSLTTPILNKLYLTFPRSINSVFSNSGNTQTTPRGVIQITNRSNRIVAQALINASSSLVLPDSKRLFPISLQQTTNLLLPGKYTFKIYYRYAGQSVYRVYQQQFYYFGIPFIILAICIAILLVLMVKYRYNILLKRKKVKSKKTVDKIDTPKRTKISIRYDDSEETIIKTHQKIN
jgi:hypothetical protein